MNTSGWELQKLFVAFAEYLSESAIHEIVKNVTGRNDIRTMKDVEELAKCIARK